MSIMWTKEEIEIVHKLGKARKTPLEISGVLARSPEAISKKLRECGYKICRPEINYAELRKLLGEK